MIGPALFTVVCSAAVVGLVVATRLGSDWGRYVCKPIASTCFVAVAAAEVFTGSSPYTLWVAIGLAVGAGGDIALMLPGKRTFTVGLFLFLAGHLAYAVAIADLVPPTSWLTPLGAVPLLGGIGVGIYVWPHAGRMRPAVGAYILTFVTVAVAALSTIGLDTTRTWLLAAGAMLFFFSDIAVARQRFVHESFTNRLLGLPAYYAGQLLIAWSVLV